LTDPQVESLMTILRSAAIVSLVLIGFGAGPLSASAATSSSPATVPVQYDRYPDQPPGGRYYPPPRRDDDYTGPHGPYGEGEFPLWRPGDVVPVEYFDSIVDDWEPRGLGRPPSGHQWVRVDPQFLLVRERDRMIARVINFD
jgi:Ni/Co efflux regulator RcnB